MCWGEESNLASQITFSGLYQGLSAGTASACAIAKPGGNIVCWGSTENGALNTPPGQFKAVSTTLGDSCAVRDDGALICWGDDLWGTGFKDVPTP